MLKKAKVSSICMQETFIKKIENALKIIEAQHVIRTWNIDELAYSAKTLIQNFNEFEMTQNSASSRPYLFLFSSGTTGLPKVAILSHRNRIGGIYSLR